MSIVVLDRGLASSDHRVPAYIPMSLVWGLKMLAAVLLVYADGVVVLDWSGEVVVLLP